MRAGIATLIATFLLPVDAHAGPEIEPRRPNPAFAAFDVVILRPLGLVVLAAGAVLFVPVAVLAAPSGRDGIDPALDLFVTGPAKHVFRRPLGDF